MSVFKNTKAEPNPNAEMGFLDHIEALRWHIVRMAVAVVVCAIAVFIKIEWIFENIIMGPAHNDFVSYKWFCALGRLLHYDAFCLSDIKMEFQNTAVTGQFMLGMSSSMMIGFILAFPYVLWELWRFIKPALKQSEIRATRGIVFWCSILFFTGVMFAYFIVAPYTINFFGNYQLSTKIRNVITTENYYDTMSNLILALGVVFELPMVVYFLSRIGILNPKFMREKRKYAILILFVLSEIITPPDLFSCLLVFFPLYALFEISVIVSGRAIAAKLKKEEAAAQNND